MPPRLTLVDTSDVTERPGGDSPAARSVAVCIPARNEAATYLAYGLRAIAEVDLGGERVHRNRPLQELTVHARDVVAAVLDRVGSAVPELADLHSTP